MRHDTLNVGLNCAAFCNPYKLMKKHLACTQNVLVWGWDGGLDVRGYCMAVS